MTREEKEELIQHLKYNLEIGADYLITDKDAVEIIKALEQEPVLDKIREVVDKWQSDIWSDTLAYEYMVKIAELVEPQVESEG